MKKHDSWVSKMTLESFEYWHITTSYRHTARWFALQTWRKQANKSLNALFSAKVARILGCRVSFDFPTSKSDWLTDWHCYCVVGFPLWIFFFCVCVYLNLYGRMFALSFKTLTACSRHKPTKTTNYLPPPPLQFFIFKQLNTTWFAFVSTLGIRRGGRVACV